MNKSFLLFGLLIILLLSVPSISFSQEIDNIGGTVFWGYSSDVEIVGNYAYVATGTGGLRILDITDPTNPIELSYFYTGLKLWNIVVDNNLVYGASEGALTIFDVTNPAQPTLISTTEFSIHSNTRVKKNGDMLIVYIGYNYIRFLDVTDPANPETLSNYNIGGNSTDYVNDIEIVDSGMILVSQLYRGIHVLDIRDPSAPSIIQTDDTETRFYSIEIVGDTLYAYTSYWLYAFDISDLSEFQVLGSYFVNNFFIATSDIMRIQGDYAYLIAGNVNSRIMRLTTVDISVPDSMEIVGSCQMTKYLNGLEVVGNTVYMTEQDDGLQILNVEDPTNPLHIGWFGGRVEAYRLDVAHNRAFVTTRRSFEASKGGFAIFDVSDPTLLTQTGFARSDSYCDGITVDNNACYISEGPGNRGISVFDMSDYDNPEWVSGFDIGSTIEETVIIDDKLIYVKNNDGQMDLSIASLENPLAPNLLSTVEGPFGYFLDSNGSHVIVSSYGDHLLSIFDITDPTNPVETGYLLDRNDDYTIEFFGSIEISGDTVYTFYRFLGDSGYEMFLYVVDISDPTNPQLLISYEDFFSLKIKIVEDHMFGLMNDSTFSIYSVENPSEIEGIYSYEYDPDEWSPTDFDLFNGYVYLSGDHRLEVFDCTGILETSSVDNFEKIPENYSLFSTYPNPFNPTLNVGIALPQASDLKVKVYNISGQLVETLTDGRYTAGEHNLIFNGNGLSSGVYFINAVVPGVLNQTRKVVLMK